MSALTKPLRIVVCVDRTDPAPWIRTLETLLPEAQIVAWRDDDGVQADYAVVWAPDPALFRAQTQLRAIFNLGAGVDGLLRIAGLPKAIPIVRLADAGMSVQMAEYVCHAVIRHSREFDRFEHEMGVEHQWRSRKPTMRGDYPVGVMGLGVIGARVAQALASFDFPVRGWSRTEHVLPNVTCYHGPDGLAPFLRASRILVCILPLTEQTKDILNRKNLSQLLPGGYVINVARGAHLVDEDLLHLLDEGILAGATLDVFREEPPPAAHRFWNHPRITLTPHISARTLREMSLIQIADKIRRHQGGETLADLIEPDRGY